MKRCAVLLKIIIIVVFMSSVLIIRSTKNVLIIKSNNISKQICTKMDQVLKINITEREKIGEELDIPINKLLAQISANMSEEYWLFKTQRKTETALSLDIYVDNIENIKHFVVVPSNKVAFLNEKGDEIYFFYIIGYDILNGNIEGLEATVGRYLETLEDVRMALNDMERIMNCELNHVKTIEAYEWPLAKQPEYKLEDLQSTEIYQNFDLYIENGFYFPTGSEVYLGLWNGYSNRVRMMYKTLGSDEKIHYYSTEMSLNGQRCDFINETTEEIYERFKLISVKMM